MGVLNFVLSDKNVDQFEAWLESHYDEIVEFQHPKKPYAILGMSMHAFVNHIKPLGNQEWEMRTTLLHGIGPDLSPLIFNTGITPLDRYKYVPPPPEDSTPPSTPEEYAADFRRDILNGARFVIQRLTISDGFYDHLVRIGWTLANVRDFEYKIIPSGIGCKSHVRPLGTEEWITLEDPNFDP